MSEEILKTDILKEKGMLYFCKESEDGYVTVNKSKAGRPIGWRKNQPSIKVPEVNGMNGHTPLTDEELKDIARKVEENIPGGEEIVV